MACHALTKLRLAAMVALLEDGADGAEEQYRAMKARPELAIGVPGQPARAARRMVDRLRQQAYLDNPGLVRKEYVGRLDGIYRASTKARDRPTALRAAELKVKHVCGDTITHRHEHVGQAEHDPIQWAKLPDHMLQAFVAATSEDAADTEIEAARAALAAAVPSNGGIAN